MYIPKHSLLSLCITCMNIFWADHLVLKNQLKCPSLGKIISPTFSITWLSVVLYQGLGSPGISLSMLECLLLLEFCC